MLQAPEKAAKAARSPAPARSRAKKPVYYFLKTNTHRSNILVIDAKPATVHLLALTVS